MITNMRHDFWRDWSLAAEAVAAKGESRRRARQQIMLHNTSELELSCIIAIVFQNIFVLKTY